jgi:hypothetical protein
MENSFLSKIDKVKEDYYEKNGKNVIFKKSQKNECAKEVSNSINIDLLIQNTTFIIPNTNKVFFNYEIFKLYANDDNYEKIYLYLLSLVKKCIQLYSNFEIHMNSNSLTISAVERYKNFIILLTQYCLKEKSNYSFLLSKLCIYNTPNSISSIIQIVMPLIDPIVRPKFILHSKNDSEELLKNLLHI